MVSNLTLGIECHSRYFCHVNARGAGNLTYPGCKPLTLQCACARVRCEIGNGNSDEAGY